LGEALANENDIRAAAFDSAACVIGLPDPLERLPITIGTVATQQKFTPDELHVIFDLAEVDPKNWAR